MNVLLVVQTTRRLFPVCAVEEHGRLTEVALRDAVTEITVYVVEKGFELLDEAIALGRDGGEFLWKTIYNVVADIHRQLPKLPLRRSKLDDGGHGLH